MYPNCCFHLDFDYSNIILVRSEYIVIMCQNEKYGFHVFLCCQLNELKKLSDFQTNKCMSIFRSYEEIT